MLVMTRAPERDYLLLDRRSDEIKGGQVGRRIEIRNDQWRTLGGLGGKCLGLRVPSSVGQ